MHLKVELLTPGSIGFCSENISSLTVPGSEGEFTVMYGHANMISAINCGIVKINEQNKTYKMLVSQGFVEISSKEAYVLVDEFFNLEDLKLEDVTGMLKKAEEEFTGEDLDAIKRESLNQKIYIFQNLIKNHF